MTDDAAYPRCKHGRAIYERCTECEADMKAGKHGGFERAPVASNLVSLPPMDSDEAEPILRAMERAIRDMARVTPLVGAQYAYEAIRSFMPRQGETPCKPAGPWISVTERVPEPEVLVLCWDGAKTFVEWFGSKPDAGRGVTHWIPYEMPPGAVSDMHDGRRAVKTSTATTDGEPV